jgi:hypothetical protein
VASMTRIACGITSFPIPSPGITAIFFFSPTRNEDNRIGSG